MRLVPLFGAVLTLAACAPTPRPPASAASSPAVIPPAPSSAAPAPPPDAHPDDPEWVALDRMEHQPLTTRRDRTGALFVPLFDVSGWVRVRLWMQPTRSAFRYGDDHFGVIAVWYTETTLDDSPEACLSRFIADAQSKAESLGGHVLAMHTVRTLQRAKRRGEAGTPMVVQVVDGRLDGIFKAKDYAGAIAASPSWPHTCLIHGFVAPAQKYPELARRVRDRWVAEAAPRLMWSPRLKAAPPVNDL